MRFFRMAVLSLAVGSALSTSAFASSDEGYIRQGRYALQEIQTASSVNSDPLQSIIQIRMGSSIKSVGEALDEILRGSGYSFSHDAGDDLEAKALKRFLKKDLPNIHRSIGPTKLVDALKIIAGSPWDVVPHSLERSVSLVLKDHMLLQRSQQIRLASTYLNAKNQDKDPSLFLKFPNGKFRLDKNSLMEVEAFTRSLAANTEITITGFSHNSSGPGSARLAKNRAESIASMLKDMGIKDSQVIIKTSIKGNVEEQVTGVEIKVRDDSIILILPPPGKVKVLIKKGKISTQFNEIAKRIGFSRGIWNAEEIIIASPSSYYTDQDKAMQSLIDSLDVCLIHSALNGVLESTSRNRTGECNEK